MPRRKSPAPLGRLRLQRGRSLALVLASLVGLAARVPRAEELSEASEPPRVDLQHIALGTHATAPIEGSGRAELTLDPALQHAASRLLAQAHPHAGGVIAIDVRSGRVLVWAEHKGARNDPSVLTNALTPSASVFKVVTSAALLERAHVSPSKRVCISGGLHGIERRHLDPPPASEASCSAFGLALGHSRNAVYAQLVTHHLMRNDLWDVAARFGFNDKVPFDGAAATVGTLELPYNDLEFARASIGFRGSALSVLGAAHLAWVIANGGRAAEIHIVERAAGYAAPEHKRLLGQVIEPETARTLTRMMEVTVHSGTSLDAFKDDSGRNYLPGIRVAGKTGTLRAHGSEDTTSWFIGFAPSRNPEIVLSVLLSNGPVWRRKAKDVARDVLRTYFAAQGRHNVTAPDVVASSLPGESARTLISAADGARDKAP